jgi:hypothetical protein
MASNKPLMMTERSPEQTNIRNLFGIINKLQDELTLSISRLGTIEKTVSGLSPSNITYYDDTYGTYVPPPSPSEDVPIYGWLFQKKLVDKDITVPSGYSWVIASPIVSGTVTINGDMVVL